MKHLRATAAQAVEEAGKTDEVAADVATMQQLLEDMGADLNSKQTDVVPDGVAPQAAETYTLDDRYQFLASLQRLLDLYNKNKQYLPEFITNELDKWLTEENLRTSSTSWACSATCITPTMRLVALT